MTTKVYNQSVNTNSTTSKKLSFSKLDPVSLVKDKAKNLKEDGNSYPNTFTIDKSDDFDKYKDDEVFTVVDLSFELTVEDTYIKDDILRSPSGSESFHSSHYSPRFQWVLYPKLSDNHNFVLPFTELTSYGLDEINGVLRVNLETLEASLDGRYFHYSSNGDYTYQTLIYTFYQRNWFNNEAELPTDNTADNYLKIILHDVKLDMKRVPIGYLLNEEG